MGLTYLLIYLISNLLQVYIVYYLYNIFLGEARTPQHIILLSYLAFFIINSLLYIFFKLPILNIAVSIVGFLLLTFNYKCALLPRIATPILVYIFMACIETVVSSMVSTGHIEFTKPNNQIHIFIPMASTITMYVISIFLGKLKNIKRSVNIPILYWAILLIIPLAALYLLLLITQSRSLPLIQIGISSTIILLFVFSTFYLYDSVIAEISNKMEKELLTQQNKFYNYQLTQMQSSSNSMQKLRHDMKNHLFALQSYAMNDKKDKLLNYLEEINSATGTNKLKAFAHSGNSVIDSIVNFKIQEALEKNIQVNATLKIPESLNISPFDLVIILGNLFDNAITAVDKLSENKKITFNITYDRGRLFLQISNPFKGEFQRKGKGILTSKFNATTHGFGLANVEDTVSKYNGTMEIEDVEQLFTVTILLYISV